MTITSAQNPVIKNILRLSEKSSERREQNLFVIEGAREIRMAFQSGYQIKQFFYYPSVASRYRHEFNYETLLPTSLKTEISASVYQKIARREGTEGMVALALPRPNRLADLQLKDPPLLIVLESVEKPGNLGAILRTADAADVDAVIVCNPRTDFYNPNVIRSSMGCVFTRQIASCTTTEVLQFLKEKKITIYATTPAASHVYHQACYTGPSALVFGTEAEGLSKEWLQQAGHQILIPMEGQIDSLNVAAAVAIVVFEAKRQRSVLSSGTK